MLHRLAASSGETIFLRPAVSKDAAELIRAVDSVARESAYKRFGFVEEGCGLRDVKDSEGCYHDVIEMSWFAPSPGAEQGGNSA